MITPLPLNNRPGLSALSYRVGTYGDFRASMLARLSDPDPAFRPLNALRTRDPGDPTIALLDAFALLGDILTFYQERLANEGFLRTATERQSVCDLARLTGYRLRPGVASSVYLAFTLDASADPVTLPAGSRAQSVPGPGQAAQSFEISSDLATTPDWNAMQPRQSRPTQASADLSAVYVAGTATGLKQNDPLLLVVAGVPTLRRVESVDAQFDRKRSVISLQSVPTKPTPPTTSSALVKTHTSPALTQSLLVSQQTDTLATAARLAPALCPPNAQALTRSTAQLFGPATEASLTLSAGLSDAQRKAVFTALAATPLTPSPALEVHAFRTATAPFGNRAPPPLSLDAEGRLQPSTTDWQLTTATYGPEVLFTVEITATWQNAPALLSRVMAAAGDNANLMVISIITFDNVTQRLSVIAAAGNHASVTLSRAFGDVTVTVNQVGAAWALTYAFSAQPLTLLISQQGNVAPTVANTQRTDALVTLELSATAALGLRVLGSLSPVTGTPPTETPGILHLDGTFETIKPGSWVAFDAPPDPAQPAPPVPQRVTAVNTVARVAYGQTARVSRLALSGSWLPAKADFGRAVRSTAVYADSVALNLVDEDINDPVEQSATQPGLELDSLVTGLASGKWLVVSGERKDLPGVTAAELVMLAAVSHGGSARPSDPVVAGETTHTTLTFASPLAYSYERSTTQVFGNVATATQGESADEILGSGNGGLANQSFVLKKPPVTYVAASTPAGSASTLQIRVNNLLWQEVPALAAAGPSDQVFETATGANGQMTVRFGDGVHGARLPTGNENIRAHYRSGLGQAGNLDTGMITSLLSRPLGLTGVSNPLPASGGADAESTDSARANAPLGLISLARLVSVADYQDFALAFAGVGKAAAQRFDGPDGPLIHITLAGAADAPLDASSQLWQSLISATRTSGDPRLDVDLAPRAARLAVISANVGVLPGQLWTDIEPQIRTALLSTFGFDQRALGQTLYLSEVIAAMQAVPGVSYVDLPILAGVAQPCTVADLQTAIQAGGAHDLVARHARVDPAWRGRPRRLLPADLVYVSDLLADMIVLTQVPA